MKWKCAQETQFNCSARWSQTISVSLTYFYIQTVKHAVQAIKVCSWVFLLKGCQIHSWQPRTLVVSWGVHQVLGEPSRKSSRSCWHTNKKQLSLKQHKALSEQKVKALKAETENVLRLAHKRQQEKTKQKNLKALVQNRKAKPQTKIIEDAPLVEFMYLVFTHMSG